MDYKQKTSAVIALLTSLPNESVFSQLSTPPDPALGDYSFPCFSLAKTLKKAPPLIASELAANINDNLPPFLQKADAMGGYLNISVNKAAFAKEAVLNVINKELSYGKANIGNGKNVCLDYSSINIAKPFHIGHLSTTVLGNSLARIYSHLGYNTVSINHLGDWGTQFGKLIVAYKMWGNKELVEKGSVNALMELYVRYHEEAEKDPSLNDTARMWFKKIEDGDKEATELFDWFKKKTLESAGKVYDLLGVKFDSYAGESFYTPYMPAVVDELKEKNLLKHDDGAYIVDLSDYNMPPCLILKKDGATLYATRDITTAIYRKETYDFCKMLYVVAYQQDLHFRQFFKVLDLMGKTWVKDLEHVSYGMVSLEDGSLSTRKGRVVLLEDVLSAAIEKTRKIIEEKNPELDNKDEIARQVGVGAVVFCPLYNNRIKDIVFSWDKVLNFDGETAPYAQYTHARCCSVLKKANLFDEAKNSPNYEALRALSDLNGIHLTDSDSFALVRQIAELPDTIISAKDKNEPYLIARKVIDICGKFNKFYYEHHIMDDDIHVKNARLLLTAATATAIKTGLFLLGINAPSRM